MLAGDLKFKSLDRISAFPRFAIRGGPPWPPAVRRRRCERDFIYTARLHFDRLDSSSDCREADVR
jgi:hypothetical protein